MEFDKSRVFTSLNADELKAGDKVLTSNNIASLKEAVRLNVKPSVIMSIWGEMYGKRFQCKSSDTIYDAEYAYLVERKANCTNCAFKETAACDKSEWKETDVKVFVCGEWQPKTEPKAEKHYRPFKDTDELVKVWDAKIGTPNWGTGGDLFMPHIWVRRKKANSKGQLITEFGNELHVSMGKEGYNMTDLFVHFTFLDGSPCEVKE